MKAEKDSLAINEMFQHLDKSKFTNLLETLSNHDKKETQLYIGEYISAAAEVAARIEEAKAKIFK